MRLHFLKLCVRSFKSEQSLRLFMESWNTKPFSVSGVLTNGKIILSRILEKRNTVELEKQMTHITKKGHVRSEQQEEQSGPQRQNKSIAK